MAIPALDIEAYVDAEHLAVLEAMPVRLDLSDIPATRAGHG